MQISKRFGVLLLGTVFAAGPVAGVALEGSAVARAESDGVYELRTYTAAPARVAEVVDELRFAAPGAGDR